MPTDSDPRVQKLPKWAQYRISTAERDRDYYKGILKKVTDEDTNVRVQDYADGDRHLPQNSSVVFTNDDGDDIIVGMRDGEVEVSTSGIGRRTRLYIRPVASNTITVVAHD